MNNNEYIERLVQVEQRSKSNTKRLDEKETKDKEQDNRISALSDIYIALTKVNDKIDNLETNFVEIKQDIKDIKKLPSERYEKVWGYVFGGVVTALISFITMYIKMKG
mgnify:CR=1 FL=1